MFKDIKEQNVFRTMFDDLALFLDNVERFHMTWYGLTILKDLSMILREFVRFLANFKTLGKLGRITGSNFL